MIPSPQSSTEASQDSSDPKEPSCRSTEEREQPAEDVAPPPLSREQMLSVLNKFGAYQRRLMLLAIFPLLMSGYTSFSVVIALDSPNHRCRVPGLINDTYSIQNEAHRRLVNFSIPMTSSDGDVSYSKCEVYKDRDVIDRSSDDDRESCDSWVYDDSDFDRTIVTQFNLVCENKGLRATINMMFILGLLVGSTLSGILCDRLGRKKMSMVFMLLNIAVVMAMSCPGLPSMLLVYRFLAGVFNITFYLSFYVLYLEFMGPSHRTLAGTLGMLPGSLGSLLNVGFSYLVRDWRWLQILNGAPFVVLISYWWLIDESPRWLLTKGRVQEAEKIIRKVMKINKMTMPVDVTFNTDAPAMTALQQNNIPPEQNDPDAGGCQTSDSSRHPLAKGDKHQGHLFARGDNQGDPFTEGGNQDQFAKGNNQEDDIGKGDNQGNPFGKGDNQEDIIGKGDNQGDPFGKGDNQEGLIGKGDNQGDQFAKGENQENLIGKGGNQGNSFTMGNKQGDLFTKGGNEEDLNAKGDNQGDPFTKGDTQGDLIAKGDTQGDLIAKGNNQGDPFTKGGNQEDTFSKGNNRSNLEMNTVTKTTDDAVENEKAETKEEEPVSPESPLKLFKYPNLIARTGIIFFNWSAVSMTFYGLSLNVSNLKGNVRLNFIYSTLVELLGLLTSWLLLDRLGRKRTHCTVMLLSGIFCLASILPLMLGSLGKERL